MDGAAYESPFVDHADIEGSDLLFRRIFPGWVDWERSDEQGNPRIRRAAFQDYPAKRADEMKYPGACMSVGIASVLQEHDRTPDHLVADHAGYGLASIGVGQARAAGQQGVMRWPTKLEPWHGVVFSKIGPRRTGAMEGELARSAKWIIVPAKP